MSSMTLEDLSAHLKKIDFCMLSTNAGSGKLTTRPMSNNGDVEYDGDSWFFSYSDTRKVADIEGTSGVLLTFTAPPSLLGKPGIFIAIEATASIVREKDVFANHWNSELTRWFPEGIDTPGLVLIKVAASTIQYWDGEETGALPLPLRQD